MNTSKQINIMVVLIFLTAVAFGGYTIWEPTRADDAQVLQDERQADFGAKTFSLNCRLCHGDRGEGGFEGGRLLQALPLNTPRLQGFVDSGLKLGVDVGVLDTVITADAEAAFEEGAILLIDKERMEVRSVEANLIEVKRGVAHTEAAAHSADAPVFVLDEAKLMESEKLVTNTITCGRVGTAMPLWGASQGGSLNDTQIQQLTNLIASGRWDLAEEHARENDIEATGDVFLTADVSISDTELPLDDVSPFREGEAIRIDEERMVVQQVGESSLVVERGALQSEAAEHAAGTRVVNQTAVQAPVNPSITGQSTDPADRKEVCGQLGPVVTEVPITSPTATSTPGPSATPTTTPGPGTVVPTPEATATPSAPTGVQEVTITAIPTIQFDLTEIRVKPGTISVRMVNEDPGIPHNFAVYTDSSASEAIAGANEGICAGPCEVTLTFEITEPGTYFFRCDVHPTLMFGDLIVEE